MKRLDELLVVENFLKQQCEMVRSLVELEKKRIEQAVLGKVKNGSS